MTKAQDDLAWLSHVGDRVSRRGFLGLAAGASVSLPIFLAACEQASTTQKVKGAVDANTLLYAVEATPGTLDREINSVQSNNAFANVLECPLYWALMPDSADSTVTVPNFATLVPHLAKSWDLSTDGRTVTLHLRQGVKSWYGNEMTSADVKWSADRGASNAGGISGFFNSALGVEQTNGGKANGEATGVQVVDKYTVTMTTKTVNTMILPFQTLLFWTAPYDSTEAKKHVTASDPWASTWLGTHGVGFGPWGPKTWEPGNQVIFTRNESYFQGKPALQRVILKDVPNPSNRLTTLIAGSVDMAEKLLYQDLGTLKHQSGVTVHQYSGNGWIQVLMNNAVAPFNDVRVRQALNYATPRDSIKQSVFAGFAQDATSPVTPGYTDFVSQGAWPTDLAKAKSLLAAAGMPNGFSTRLTYNSDSSTHQQIAEILRTQFAMIGVQLTLNGVATAIWSKLETSHTEPMIFGDEQALLPTANYQMWIYYTIGGPAANASYSNPEASQKILSGFSTLDTAARAALMADAQKIIWNDCPWIWGWYEGWQLPARSYVKGLRWCESNVPVWKNVTFG